MADKLQLLRRMSPAARQEYQRAELEAFQLMQVMEAAYAEHDWIEFDRLNRLEYAARLRVIGLLAEVEQSVE